MDSNHTFFNSYNNNNNNTTRIYDDNDQVVTKKTSNKTNWIFEDEKSSSSSSSSSYYSEESTTTPSHQRYVNELERDFLHDGPALFFNESFLISEGGSMTYDDDDDDNDNDDHIVFVDDDDDDKLNLSFVTLEENNSYVSNEIDASDLLGMKSGVSNTDVNHDGTSTNIFDLSMNLDSNVVKDDKAEASAPTGQKKIYELSDKSNGPNTGSFTVLKQTMDEQDHHENENAIQSTIALCKQIETLYQIREQHNLTLEDDIIHLQTLQTKLSRHMRRCRKNHMLQTSCSYIDITGEDVHIVKLSHDTFSLMKVSWIFSRSWFFSLFVFFVQLLLLIMIITQQSNVAQDQTRIQNHFNIPFKSNWFMRLAQSMGILVTVAVSRDLFVPITELSTLWVTNVVEWAKVAGVEEEEATMRLWVTRILLPDALQFITGCLALIISFIIIIQSDNVIYLFAEFAAMGIIAEIDVIAFWFGDNGFIGTIVRCDIRRVKEILIEDRSRRSNRFVSNSQIRMRSVVFLVLVFVSYIAFIIVVIGQNGGYFFRLKYPSCDISPQEMFQLGDGVCNGGYVNSYKCGFDDGDCIDYNIAYPLCNASTPMEIGDNVCHEKHNFAACGYDGGDCCPVKDDKHLGDGVCHGGWFNTADCLYDNGDCDEIRKNQLACPDYRATVVGNDGNPIELNTGVCNDDKEYIEAYMTEECGWVFGDCINVRQIDLKQRSKYSECRGLRDYFRIGDGRCDGGVYLTEECGWEEYDCCELDHSKIGDQICDSTNMNEEGMYLTAACGYEELDCCLLPAFAGNGNCFDGVSFLLYSYHVSTLTRS